MRKKGIELHIDPNHKSNDANRNRLDVGFRAGATDVSNARQGFILGKSVIFAAILTPDRAMNPLRVA